MRDLVRLSDEELHELTTPQRLRVIVAIGISLACGIISLQGMAALFTDATVVPLPGMQHLPGQIAWAIALVGMLILVTFLVRGVIKRRLQWAIALSLLIHFLLCLSMTAVEFRGPRPQPVQAADLSSVPREEFTLPDYAGMDSPSADAPWKEVTETETPEVDREPEKSETQLADSEKAEAENTELLLQPERITTPERQEKVSLPEDARTAMNRQSSGAAETAAEAESVDVSTAAAGEAVIDDRVEQARQAMRAPRSARVSEEVSVTEMTIEARRSEAQRFDASIVPETVKTQRSNRGVSEIQPAPAAEAENFSTPAKAAAAMELSESQFEVARRAPQAAAAKMTAALPSSTETETSLQSRAPQAAAVREMETSAPEDGGQIAVSRRASVPDIAGSTNRESAVLQLADSGEASSASPAESSIANAGRRRSAAEVPSGSALAGNQAGGLSIAGGKASAGDLRTSGIARSSTGTGQPVPDDGADGSMAGRSRTSRNVSGVDSVGREAAVASRSGTRNQSAKGSQSSPGEASSGAAAGRRTGAEQAGAGDALIAGPAATSTGRRSSALPSSAESGRSLSGNSVSGTGNTMARSSSAGGEDSSIAVIRPALAGIPTGRGTEPSARLQSTDSEGRSTRSRSGETRSVGSSAGLPLGAVEAEQSGTLVFTGPQSVSDGSASGSVEGAFGGKETGPRVASVPRRSAGLPGMNGPAGNAATSGNSSAGAEPSRIPSAAGRRGAGSDRPAIASSEQLAGLVKRSLPGPGVTAEARIPESLSMRSTNARREAARTLGGSEQSEEAVELGLAWLAANQHSDGHWSLHDFPGENIAGAGEGSFESNSAATGMALLAFLGAGYTHREGRYQSSVSQGMKWLTDNQKSDGDLFVDETEFVWFYSHGIASIALCEAYGLTRDAALKEPAQRALDFIVRSQHPEFGGWRYKPRFESDTSVSGWQLMALKSGEMAGLRVPPETYRKVSGWLDSVQSRSDAGQFSYHPSRDASPAMTAEGLLMRQYLGAKRSDPELIAGANFLRTRLPDFGQRDAYYWYYATQVMFHMQGDHWEEWNAGLRDLLVTTQSKDGWGKGSWDPLKPTPEKWANGGGRHYLTCFNLLMLEVYYRHLPLYLELEK